MGEQVEPINQQAKDDYAAFGRKEVKKARGAARRGRKSERWGVAPYLLSLQGAFPSLL